jgi:hypothetical protein
MELDLVRRRLIYLVRYRLIERTQEHVSKEPATIPSPCFKVQRGVGCNLLGITSAFAMPVMCVLDSDVPKVRYLSI